MAASPCLHLDVAPVAQFRALVGRRAISPLCPTDPGTVCHGTAGVGVYAKCLPRRASHVPGVQVGTPPFCDVLSSHDYSRPWHPMLQAALAITVKPSPGRQAMPTGLMPGQVAPRWHVARYLARHEPYDRCWVPGSRLATGADSVRVRVHGGEPCTCRGLRAGCMPLCPWHVARSRLS